MIGLALLTGVVLGLRFRVGLVLTATAAVIALGLGLHIRDDGEAAAVLAGAAFYAALLQVVAFLVFVAREVLADNAQARA